MKIAKGEVVIFPTDTVYGIGAMLSDIEGQKRIFAIKKRDLAKQLPILCASIEQVEEIVELNNNAKILAKKYWPGGLTIVAKSLKTQGYFTAYDTIAVRIPNNPLAKRIILENGPFATTSVNISGSSPIIDPIQIEKEFGKLVDHIFIEEKGVYSNVSSTIVDMTEETPKILREGNISEQEIFTILGIK